MSIKTQIDRLKSNIQNCLAAVTSKGVTVSSGSTSDDLAGLISQINNGAGATAAASDIASGKTATVNGVTVTGTYSPPSLASQTPGTAAAGDIASGKTAWVNGEQVTGNYVAPASGYQYEEVSVNGGNNRTGITVTSSFDSIAAYALVPSSTASNMSNTGANLALYAHGNKVYGVKSADHANAYTRTSQIGTVTINGNIISCSFSDSYAHVVPNLKVFVIGN